MLWCDVTTFDYHKRCGWFRQHGIIQTVFQISNSNERQHHREMQVHHIMKKLASLLIPFHASVAQALITCQWFGHSWNVLMGAHQHILWLAFDWSLNAGQCFFSHPFSHGAAIVLGMFSHGVQPDCSMCVQCSGASLSNKKQGSFHCHIHDDDGTLLFKENEPRCLELSCQILWTFKDTWDNEFCFTLSLVCKSLCMLRRLSLTRDASFIRECQNFNTLQLVDNSL